MDTHIKTSWSFVAREKELAREASEINAVVSQNLHFRGQLAVTLTLINALTALLTSLLPKTTTRKRHRAKEWYKRKGSHESSWKEVSNCIAYHLRGRYCNWF